MQIKSIQIHRVAKTFSHNGFGRDRASVLMSLTIYSFFYLEENKTSYAVIFEK